MFKTVLFDMDGTLMDTIEDLTDSVNVVLGELGYPVRSLEEVRSFVGNGQKNLMIRALGGDAPEETVERAYARMRAYYSTHCQIKTKPYDGILELLDALREKDVKIAVVSNKMDAATQAICRSKFGGRIEVVIGDDPQRRRKPHPDGIRAALAALHETEEGALYVGDSEVDVATAQNAGIPLIAVDWGFRTREQLLAAGATKIAHNVEELKTMLLTSNAQTDIG